MSGLNICLLSHEFPPRIGGEASYASFIAKTISNMGHNLIIMTSNTEGQMNISNNENFNIKYISTIKTTPFESFLFNIRTKKALLNLLKTNKMDIIHQTYDYNTFPISKDKINVPIITTIHHPFKEERKLIKANLSFMEYLNYLSRRRLHYLEIMQKKLCERADKIISVSTYTARSVIKEFNIPPDKIEVIPNGVDINRFNPNINVEEMREKWGIQSEPIVLFVGRLDYNKGIKYLIGGFSKLIKDISDAKLVIVGQGPDRDHLNHLIDKHNLIKSVILAGRVENKDLPKAYCASNVIVLPSLMEGFGISLLEAMACGKPCIATSAGGTTDVVVDGKTGFIVPPSDPLSLYQAMYTLLSDDNLSQKFGMASRKRAEKNFAWDAIAKRTINLYEEMI
jgi:glycosyltransferase involved in cell wall biosynthesis